MNAPSYPWDTHESFRPQNKFSRLSFYQRLTHVCFLKKSLLTDLLSSFCCAGSCHTHGVGMSWCARRKNWSLGWWTSSCLGQGICTHSWVGQNCLCNWASNLSKSRYSNSVDSLIMGWQNDDAWLLFWGSSTALANNVKERSWTQTFRQQ